MEEEVIVEYPGNCKLCKATPVPSVYGSPRRCAFDDSGNFTPDNWNCCTANFLRVCCGEGIDRDDQGEELMWVRRNDQSYAAIWIPPHPEDIPDGEAMGAFRGGGFLALTWYKHRGCTDIILRVDPRDGGTPDNSGRALTLREAEQAVENLRLRGMRAQ